MIIQSRFHFPFSPYPDLLIANICIFGFISLSWTNVAIICRNKTLQRIEGTRQFHYTMENNANITKGWSEWEERLRWLAVSAIIMHDYPVYFAGIALLAIFSVTWSLRSRLENSLVISIHRYVPLNQWCNRVPRRWSQPITVCKLFSI